MWCLYALAQRPEVQARLREELLSVSSDTPTMDELYALPFLDAVLKETMRLLRSLEAVASSMWVSHSRKPIQTQQIHLVDNLYSVQGLPWYHLILNLT